jgi:hypothetical protein
MNRGKLWHSGPLTNGHSRTLLKVSICTQYSDTRAQGVFGKVGKGEEVAVGQSGVGVTNVCEELCTRRMRSQHRILKGL